MLEIKVVYVFIIIKVIENMDEVNVVSLLWIVGVKRLIIKLIVMVK